MIFIIALEQDLNKYGIDTSTLTTAIDGRKMYHAELTAILTNEQKMDMFNDNNVKAVSESEWRALLPISDEVI